MGALFGSFAGFARRSWSVARRVGPGAVDLGRVIALGPARAQVLVRRGRVDGPLARPRVVDPERRMVLPDVQVNEARVWVIPDPTLFECATQVVPQVGGLDPLDPEVAGQPLHVR